MGKKITIISSSETITKSIIGILKDNGYNSIIEFNPLKIDFEEGKNIWSHSDIAIIDGTGKENLKYKIETIKNSRESIKVILLHYYKEKEIVNLFYSYGVDKYLEVSFTPPELVNSILSLS